MSTLVIAEHSNNELKSATHHTVTAAQALGGEIHVLVAGGGCQAAADAAARIPGVAKLLVAGTIAETKLVGGGRKGRQLDVKAQT